ncbi:unnamed protein product [Fraxinus pennsylvanica]|uniref:Uncharacterized protein n=1 Tax=Fraxinus pennsylvanica TaxID=56036 RepID=A0AAD2A068_9LAMI|nr:unnamed protein product [Fraxinus pennsylvanica]
MIRQLLKDRFEVRKFGNAERKNQASHWLALLLSFTVKEDLRGQKGSALVVDDQPDSVGEREENSFDVMAVSLAEERLNTRSRRGGGGLVTASRAEMAVILETVAVGVTRMKFCDGLSISEVNLLKTNELDAMVKRVCGRKISDCLKRADEEDQMDSESNRRVLAFHRRYISYDTLKRDTVPCSRPGVSYYNSAEAQDRPEIVMQKLILLRLMMLPLVTEDSRSK